VERILLIGAGGQLGTDLRRALPADQLVPLTRAELDITDPEATERVLADHRPAWVVNTSAFHRVDDIETKYARQAFALNAVAVDDLARACARRNVRLLHLSTDYVFGAGLPGPYTEDAVPAPSSIYGLSKLAGEHLIRQASPDHVIVRSSGLYGVAGSSGKGGNFVETMLRLAKANKDIQVVDDQVLSPTYAEDLALAITRLIAIHPPGGIFHLTNAGECSWFRFAQEIFRIAKLTPRLEPTTSEKYRDRAPAPRPSYSVLVNTRTAALGLAPLRPWPEALAAYLRAKGHRAD
jgi:dTDP-4-dehydrorhamnose reductase